MRPDDKPPSLPAFKLLHRAASYRDQEGRLYVKTNDPLVYYVLLPPGETRRRNRERNDTLEFPNSGDVIRLRQACASSRIEETDEDDSDEDTDVLEATVDSTEWQARRCVGLVWWLSAPTRGSDETDTAVPASALDRILAQYA